MFFYEGYHCPVCGKEFVETDDIATCPDCGAPHHRACWYQEGHCHFADAHGTAEQWKRPDRTAQAETTDKTTKKCPHCGAENPEFAEFCAYCGQAIGENPWKSAATPPPGAVPGSDSRRYNEYAPFRMPTYDPLGGVPKDESIDGVSAEDLALCTNNNSTYYVPRFEKMAGERQEKPSKISWNWPAFLIPPYWLLYRKQYVAGTICAALWVVLSVLQNFIVLTLVGNATNILDMNAALQQSMLDGRFDQYAPVLMLLYFAWILLHVIFGLFGNYLYFRTCKRRVQKARQDNPNAYQSQLLRSGGVSIAFAMIAYMVIWMAGVMQI